MVDFVNDDTGSVLKVTCKDNTNTVIDLTGSSVNLRWKSRIGIVQTKVMTLDGDPTTGIATYKFLAGELIQPHMEFEVEVTDSSGFIISNLNLITVNVRKGLA